MGLFSTAAHATTNLHTYDSGSSVASLDVFGQLRYTYVYENSSANYSDFFHDKLIYQSSLLRTRIGIQGKISDYNLLTFGFQARFDHYFMAYRQRYHLENIIGSDTNTLHYREGFTLTRGYVYLSKPELGTLLYGKYVTVADDRFQNDLEYDFFDNESKFTAFSVSSGDYDSTLTYYLPVFSGFTGGISYGKTKSDVNSYTGQFATNLNYSYLGHYVSFTYANTKAKINNRTSTIFNSYDLAYYNSSLLNNLTLGFDLAYQNRHANLTGSNLSNALYNEKSWSIAFKSEYYLNQYFNPYVGISYVHNKRENNIYTDNTIKQYN
ncbi:hypothetical protein CJP74_04405, partial [Psittacicella melopsittaci]